MAYVTKEMLEFRIKKAFGIIKKRDKAAKFDDWLPVLNIVAKKRGEDGLYEFARTVDLND